jgi:peptide/nickel transport system permease protein
MIFGKKKSVDEGFSEVSIINKETEGLSQGQIVRKRFLQHKAAMVAVFTLSSLIIFVFSALKLKIGPWTYPGWWPYGIEDLPDLTTGCKDGLVGCPTASLRPKWLGGSGIGLGEHPFGQDDIGRDYFALVMRGAQRSLMVTVIIGVIGGAIGTVVGAVAGFYRGTVDAVLMRITDFIITVPSIIIGSVIGFHFGNLGVAFLAFYLALCAVSS